MIMINRKRFPWEEGLTIKILLKNLIDSGEFIALINSSTVVRVNDTIVRPNQFEEYIIQDEDNVILLPHIVGG